MYAAQTRPVCLHVYLANQEPRNKVSLTKRQYKERKQQIVPQHKSSYKPHSVYQQHITNNRLTMQLMMMYIKKIKKKKNKQTSQTIWLDQCSQNFYDRQIRIERGQLDCTQRTPPFYRVDHFDSVTVLGQKEENVSSTVRSLHVTSVKPAQRPVLFSQ
jgi:hypothetical protein